MQTLKKIFKIVIAIILIPTFILIGIILWSNYTGSEVSVPWNGSTSSFLTNAAIHTEKIYDSTGETCLGRRGYIYISNDNLSSMTPSQYMGFYESKLKDSGYLWFSIICPDGTGLYVPDPKLGTACYCTMDSLGRVVQLRGYLLVEEGKCTYSAIE